MTHDAPKLDKAFIAQQHKKLLELQKQLQSTLGGQEADEAGIKAQNDGEAREAEDDAQTLDALEVDARLADRSAQRLAAITHAIQKIENGTYGLSDASGKPISRDRLEAVPEAVTTMEEERAKEAKS